MDKNQLFEVIIIGIYLLGVLIIGVRSARQVRTSLDYTLAGRQVPWIIVLATTAATMVGGGASVGMVGRVYEVGVAAALITCAWYLQLILTGVLIAPRLRRLNLITVGDYFELKFGILARTMAVVNCWVFLMGGLTAQLVAMGTITNVILGVDYHLALVIGSVVTIFYATVGGMRAVVKTDVLQFVILVVGFTAAATLLLIRAGGFEGMAQQVGREPFHLTSHWSWPRIASLFVAFLLGETFIPPYVMRCFIARDSRHAQWGVTGAGLFLLFFMPVTTFILGVSALADPSVAQAVGDNPQLAFPTLVRTAFPPFFSGILIGGLMAAVMSSADSILSCLATSSMEDIYRGHFRPQASDRQLLKVAQRSTLAAGAVATVCAYFFSDILTIFEFIYDFWAPAMILPFFIGIFWYRPTRVYSVVASMIGGMCGAMVWLIVQRTSSAWLETKVGWLVDVSPAIVGLVTGVVWLGLAWVLNQHPPKGRLFQPQSPRGVLESGY